MNRNNMPKEKILKKIGTIIEVLPAKMFRVSLDDTPELIVLAILNNKLIGRGKRTRIQFAKADQVEMEITPYDLTRGRIIKNITSFKSNYKKI